jgi:hypothetical protein
MSGYCALSEGDKAQARGDMLTATLAYRESISWAFPLVAPWREEASEKLWAMGFAQEKQGQYAQAVQSFSMLRAGLFASRSLLGLDETWRDKVDVQLAPLMARWEAQSALEEGRKIPGPLTQRTEHFADILARDVLPNRAWGLWAVFFFCFWVFAFFRATQRDGKERKRWLGIGLISFVLFLLGLALA